MIIGVSGKARSGKDLLCSMAQTDGWKRIAFADELKRRVREDFGLTLSHTDGALKEQFTKFEKLIYDPGDIHKSYWTPREMMIEYGQFYRQFDPLYWVNIALNRIHGMTKDDNYMVTDVRFPNEANAIKSRGGFLIRLERHPDRDNLVSPETQKNISETALDDYQGFDYVLKAEDNKTPDDLMKFWRGLHKLTQIRL